MTHNASCARLYTWDTEPDDLQNICPSSFRRIMHPLYKNSQLPSELPDRAKIWLGRKGLIWALLGTLENWGSEGRKTSVIHMMATQRLNKFYSAFFAILQVYQSFSSTNWQLYHTIELTTPTNDFQICVTLCSDLLSNSLLFGSFDLVWKESEIKSVSFLTNLHTINSPKL